MDMKTLPGDWDWVSARHECSPRKFFERLDLLAQQNVKQRNAIGGAAFGHVSHKSLFSVFGENRSGPLGSPAVRFVLDDKGRGMSKSKGNVVWADKVLKKYDVDTLRYWVGSATFGNGPLSRCCFRSNLK